MGDNYFKGQAESFRRRRDLAKRAFDQPGLFSRPDVVESRFDGKPWGHNQYVDGETLWAVPSKSRAEIALLRGSSKVGFIDGEGAKMLLSECGSKALPEVVPLVVSSVNVVSGVAQLRVGGGGK